ncbi:uncharacterized protein LOC124279009 [Haliotis rubra]|uniref:uncharacterized protein LOC124279009 n=1 Tax=Haliotis rubra TaxID=36100 RepID=UPI001EE4FEC5|nr:uncharacterized protein LOC124279009 [Haliotis rubra]
MMAASADDTSDDPGDITRSVGLGFSMVIKSLKLKFPKVSNITTKELADWLKPGSDTDVILIDSRPKEEYDVSHIEGSTRVDWEADDAQIVQDIPSLNQTGPESTDRKRVVVCYCSVGYRSSATAQKIQALFAKQESHASVPVYNLEGSLFKWANERRRMVDAANQKTELAHPYNSVWGKLLDKELRQTSS